MNTRTSPSSDAAQIALRGLTITAGGRTLLREATVEFPSGAITLIVGCSGVGKSLLLRVLAGLHQPGDRGVEVKGEAIVGSSSSETSSSSEKRVSPAAVGVVFQHFALFDEWSPRDNVRFAHAHRRNRKDASAPESLLEELAVPPRTRTGLLSGGQRQRLAIARTLAFQPEVILYDEPTSGLDVATAAQVADLIARTHERHGQTSVIVTHDFISLAPIADAIFLFDWRSQSLVEIPRDEWPNLRERLDPPPQTVRATSGKRDPLPRRAVRAGVRGASDFFIATSRAVEEAVAIPWRLLPLWKSPRWGLRCLGHFLRLTAGPTAWIYLAIAGAIAGFVTTFFTFRFLPYARYTEALLIEDLLAAMGFALYRLFTPILVTILVAARCGAAVASDVGGRAYGRQLDALRVLNAPPSRYLLTNVLYAFALGTPFLLAIGYAAAAFVSLAVFTATHPERGPEFWELHYHHRLREPGAWWYDGTGWLLAKTLACALGVGAIAYHRGAASKSSPRDVSEAVTSTVLWATLYVLAVHFAFAFFEFEKYAVR